MVFPGFLKKEAMVTVAIFRYFYYYRNMDVKTAAVAFNALAQESRLRVFRLLVSAGLEGLPAGEIADRLSIPSGTLTFHLKELTHAGLIASERNGRSICYAIHSTGVSQLITYLLQDCCSGRPELCGVNCASEECSATPEKR